MSLKKNVYKNLKMNDLIVYSQKGDLLALEELIKREQKHIYITFLYLCKNQTKIQDLTQEVLLKVVNNISNLKNPKSFKSWLNQIIMNIFYDDLRKCSKHNVISYDYFNLDKNFVSEPFLDAPDYHEKPLEKCLSCELEDIIKHEIQNLPGYLKIPIVLREFQGLTYDEIAKTTNTNIGTIKSRIARGRMKLQDNLKNYINKGEST